MNIPRAPRSPFPPIRSMSSSILPGRQDRTFQAAENLHHNWLARSFPNCRPTSARALKRKTYPIFVCSGNGLPILPKFSFSMKITSIQFIRRRSSRRSVRLGLSEYVSNSKKLAFATRDRYIAREAGGSRWSPYGSMIDSSFLRANYERSFPKTIVGREKTFPEISIG